MVRDIIILIAVFMVIPVDGSSDYISDYRNKCNELIMAGQSIEEDQRLWQLFDANWKYQMEASPESATWRGYPGQNHRWSDLSLQALNDGKEIDRLTLKTILSIKRSKLSEENQLNYDLFRRNAEMAVEKQQFPGNYLIINQMEGLPRDVPSMIEMMPRSNIEDYEAILLRLSGIPKLIDQTIVLLQEGMARGIVPPKIPLRTLSDQVAGQIQKVAFDSPMLSLSDRFHRQFQKKNKIVLNNLLKIHI